MTKLLDGATQNAAGKPGTRLRVIKKEDNN